MANEAKAQQDACIGSLPPHPELPSGSTPSSKLPQALTKFMEEREAVSTRDFEIICAHVDAMQAVIRQDIKGDGDKIGNQIVDGLSELVLKED